jgi:hypothetical protein
MLRSLILAAALGLLALPAQAKPCDGPEFRQFDFWVGRWQVTPTGRDQVVAESLIEKLYDGCAIRENWMPKNSAGGGSLNGYRPETKTWRQVWLDKDGLWTEYEGRWTGQAMVMQTKGPELSRMTFTPNPDGSVRQLGEDSKDGGKTWKPSFDFTYRKAS